MGWASPTLRTGLVETNVVPRRPDHFMHAQLPSPVCDQSLCDPMDCSRPGSSVHDHSLHNPEIRKPCSYMPIEKNHVKVKLGDVGLICSTGKEAAFKSQVTPAQKNSVKFKFSTCVLKEAERAKRFCLSFYRRGQWRNYQTNVTFSPEKKKVSRLNRGKNLHRS